MGNIERLLTKYVDELNLGNKPDIKHYLELCDLDDRREFIELVEMMNIFKEYSNPVIPNRNKAQKLFNKLDNIQKEKVKTASNEKYAANFRKGQLESEDEKMLKKKLDDIWNEEFGED